MDQLFALLGNPTPENLLLMAVALLVLFIVLRALLGIARFLFNLGIWILVAAVIGAAIYYLTQ